MILYSLKEIQVRDSSLKDASHGLQLHRFVWVEECGIKVASYHPSCLYFQLARIESVAFVAVIVNPLVWLTVKFDFGIATSYNDTLEYSKRNATS